MRIHRSLTAIVLLFFTMIGCNKAPSSEVSSLYPDSLFKYLGKTRVFHDSLLVDYDRKSMKFNLHELDNEARKLLTDTVLGSHILYGAYFYSKQDMVRGLLPILVLVTADDYQSVVLIILSKHKVIDYAELTTDVCDVLEETQDKEIVGCQKRDSWFLNDTTLRVTDLSIIIDGYGNKNSITKTDSITWEYKITSTGLIRKIQIDSVRFVRESTK